MRLALHHLALHPRGSADPYTCRYQQAQTVPTQLLGDLDAALLTAQQISLCNPAHDPQWHAAHHGQMHPDLLAWIRSGRQSIPAVETAAAACRAWLARPVQLDLLELIGAAA